jgi:hypothetical protein
MNRGHARPAASNPLPADGRADLHVHPAGNGSSLADAAAFLAAVRAAGLDLVGLASHDRVDVALDLAARGADAGFELVVGEEVTTREGHLVGLGLTARVAPGKSLGDTIAAVHAQGGLAIVAHPLLAMPNSASATVLRALADGPPDRRPDAIESLNARAAWLPGYRRRVERLAAEAGYAVVGASDAHRPANIGRAVTRYPGRSFADLREAIAAGQTVAEGRAYGLRDFHRAARRLAGRSAG